MIEAVNDSGRYFAIPYGPSGTAPSSDVHAFELYFERLEKAGLGDTKRPDLLVFRQSDTREIHEFLNGIGGPQELPFIEETKLSFLLNKAIAAIECENSLWRAKRMPDYATNFSPQKRLNGKLGLKRTSVAPTIIIKEEDREPLKAWENQNHVPIHIWHVFYDLAFGILLDEAERLLSDGFIEPIVQTFQAPGGATTKKIIYKIHYNYGYPLGEAVEEPLLVPACIEDKNGHILPYVKFVGGHLKLQQETIGILDSL